MDGQWTTLSRPLSHPNYFIHVLILHTHTRQCVAHLCYIVLPDPLKNKWLCRRQWKNFQFSSWLRTDCPCQNERLKKGKVEKEYRVTSYSTTIATHHFYHYLQHMRIALSLRSFLGTMNEEEVCSLRCWVMVVVVEPSWSFTSMQL
jgi:hypothetical protein